VSGPNSVPLTPSSHASISAFLFSVKPGPCSAFHGSVRKAGARSRLMAVCDGRWSGSCPVGCAGRESPVERLHRIQPRPGGPSEVEPPTWMSREPSLHLGMPVSCVVVDRGLNQLAWRNRPLDCLEEADELPTPVPLHAAADHCALRHVQCGEQRRRAMALVVSRSTTGGPNSASITPEGYTERDRT
jgi:hypothetical protein